MGEGKDTSSLARMFGSANDKDTKDDDDGPSTDDVRKAKSDAFDSFWDALHGKDKEGARRAWQAMHGGDDDEEEDDGAPEDDESGAYASQ
jgi:hypothetical protein